MLLDVVVFIVPNAQGVGPAASEARFGFSLCDRPTNDRKIFALHPLPFYSLNIAFLRTGNS